MGDSQAPDQSSVIAFEYRGVEVRFDLPDRQDHIQKTIARDKTFYEADLLEDIRYRVLPGQLALDIGANIGNHTLFLAKICGLKVVAFEPLPHLHEILTHNIELNELADRVTARNVAVGAETGRGRMVSPDPNNLGQSRLQRQEQGTTEVLALDSLSFDQPVSLLKIDVEGMELDVLRGAEQLIGRDLPLIYIEAAEWEEQREVQQFLSRYPYHCVARYNWTPTYLFMPAVDEPRKFTALMARLDRIQFGSGCRPGDMQSGQGVSLPENASMQLGVEHLGSALQEKNRKLEQAQAEIRNLHVRLERERMQSDQQKAELHRRIDEIAADRDYKGRRVEQLMAAVADLKGRIERVRREVAYAYSTRRYRLGEAISLAMKPSMDTLKLPGRLWHILRTPPAAEQPGSLAEMKKKSAADAKLAAIDRRFRENFDQFREKVRQGEYAHVVIMYGGTTFMQRIRANRPIRLTRCFDAMNVPVLFNYHRWDENEEIPEYDGGLIFQSPIDKTGDLVEQWVADDIGRARGLFVVSYPHPSVCRLINLAAANGWATLYDCRDDWEEFHKVGMAKWYARSVEKYVLNNCDQSCCVSRPLKQKLDGWTLSRRVLVLPNAYDREFLSEGYHRTPSADPVIGYFGHLTDRWFDWRSLLEVARRRPAWRFEIVGHGAPQGLDLPGNVSLLGPKNHAEICALAAHWRVGIIPFKVSPLSDGVDPIKIYEYFALGLPVVSFRMPQIADYPYTQTVETVDDFVVALDKAIAEPVDEARLREFLDKNTWELRARQMLDWTDEILSVRPPEKTFNRSAVGAS